MDHIKTVASLKTKQNPLKNLLEIGLRVVFVHFDNITKVVNQAELPGIPLINFLKRINKPLWGNIKIASFPQMS